MDEVEQKRAQMDANLKAAAQGGYHEFLSSDSLLRPSNAMLWASMKSKEPDLSFQKPQGWDTLFQGYDKRLEHNNKVHDLLTEYPNDPNIHNPWMMYQEHPTSTKKPVPGGYGKP